MKNIKIIIIGLVVIASSYFLFSYLNKYLYKPKAAIEQVAVTYNPVSTTVNPGANFNLGVTLQAANSKKISAVDLTFKFDNSLSYVSYQTLPQNYFSDQVLVTGTTVASGSGLTTVRLVLVAKKQEADLGSSVVINFSFQAANQTGQATFALEKALSQVVGPTEGNYFEINETNGPVGIGIGTTPPTVTVIPTTSTSVTPPITEPPATGTASLNLKLKFQGITQKPADSFNSLGVSVKVVGNGVQVATSAPVVFTSDANGVWQSSTPIVFNSQLPAGSGYTVYVKGDKHIQKKVCANTPTETSPGSYHCSSGKITLVNGVNNLDFSAILMMAGDLPVQDGVVNSYDVTLIRNNLGKTDSNTLSSADINKDGIVNTQDHSLVIYALSTRFDEE